MVLKRKFSIIISLFVCLFALLGLTSCNENKESETPQNNYSQEKKDFVEALKVSFIDNLKDPSSLKITKISESYCDSKLIVFTCTSKNSFGASVSSEYIIVVNNIKYGPEYSSTDISNTKYNGHVIKKGYFVEYNLINDYSVDALMSLTTSDWCISYITIADSLNKDNTININVGNANKLLNEYYTEMGWI